MPENTDYQAFCDRVCSYVMSYELGIPFQWDIPLPTAGNGRRGSGVRENIRLCAIDRQIHYYQRTPAGEEYEIQPEGSLWWFPRIPEHLPPPATEDQLQATEDLLGFSLLPALRVLYKRVANGGFGPGWDGLFCTPGCQDARSWVLTDQYQFLKEGKQPIALSACEQRMFQRGNDYAKYLADWEIRVPRGYWPERLLPLSHDGCAIFYFLDVPTGRVFLDDEGLFALRLMANSLEELFERWMRDDLSEHPALPVKGSRQLNDQFPFDDPFDPFLDLDL
jgi:hypothetical protein